MAVVDEAFWAGRRVLITGHTGFKGAWLALWLEALGASVWGLADGVPTEPSLHALARVGEGIDEVRADVRDLDAVRRAMVAARPSVVLHLAAQPLVRRSYEAPAETFAVNVQGTAHVLEAVRSVGGVEAVVVVTSDKCYAPGEAVGGSAGESTAEVESSARAGAGHRESDPLGGRDPYSASKAAAELVTAAYRASYGLPLATARAGNVIGGGDWGADRLLPDVMAAALGGAPVELRAPDAVRPWQHVLNPLAGYLLLAERIAEGDAEAASAWNFGPAPEEAIPVRALVERLGELWGSSLAVTAQPGDHPHETATLRLDSTRARERLGWSPAWDLDDGLRAIVDWYRAYAAGADPRDTTLSQIAAYQRAARRPESARGAAPA
ncbi:MAG TPA: CDP-glucose 4,6-dehydratase [Solirubrobacteraceae bacterium]|jgi:CDP-glucose 4,6-dehydratase|nr:CDP-glucose 4,6-dehydratase [Solirubrobacteraceae bacterium]